MARVKCIGIRETLPSSWLYPVKWCNSGTHGKEPTEGRDFDTP